MARAIDPTVGDGILVVDKPAGWTSHQVVGACRRLAGTRKVGHAGTLDPMATGVLVVGVNRATRLLTYLVGADKGYSATIRLGASTITDDADGDVTATAEPARLAVVTDDEIREAVQALTGDVQQVPSAVSALKINGQRAYARVRAGEDVELAARPVTVSRFQVLQIRRGPLIDLDVEVTVSSGTYVRALARDLGEALGVGGHLIALRRTRVGGMTLAQAHTMEELEAARAAGAPRELEPGVPGTSGLPLLPLGQAAREVMPHRLLDTEGARQVSHGVRIASEQPGRVGPVAAYAPDGTLVAILDESGPRVRAEVVFAP